MRIVVIGVGNRFRRDDGAGPLALDRLAGVMPDTVELVESDGEPGRLLDAWEGAGMAVVIEAVRHGAKPGAVLRAEVDDGFDTRALRAGGGTHNLGVSAAIALGRILGRMPRRLVVTGVEPGDLAHGQGLSSPVESSLQDLVAMTVDEVRTWSADHVR